MSGATFEMEDQRQWLDASFKTYCNRLSDPHPYLVSAGQTVEQSIDFRITTDTHTRTSVTPSSHPNDTVDAVGSVPSVTPRLPPIGVGLSAKCLDRIDKLPGDLDDGGGDGVTWVMVVVMVVMV